MVDSSKNKKIDSNGSCDEGLMRVAAIAAVQSYLRSQEEEKAKGISDKYKNSVSGWAYASLAEGIGNKPFSSPPDNKRDTKVWREVLLSLVAISVSMISAVEPGYCQEIASVSEPERTTGDTRKISSRIDSPSVRPPFAPAFTRQIKYKPVRQLVEPHVFMYNKFVPTENIVVEQNQPIQPAEPVQAPAFGSSKKTVFVKVGLLTGVRKLEFDTYDGAQVIDLSSGRIVAEIQPEGKFIVASSSRGGRGVIAFSPKGSIDRRFFAKIDSSVRKVSFTPRTQPRVPYIVRSQSRKRRIASLPSVLNVPIRPGALPKEYLSGRSLNDLSTLSGVLIAPKNYATESSKSVFSLNGRAYRGALLIAPRTVKNKRGHSINVLNAINVIDIEDYLFSVIPSEMPHKWPLEALKAQAIAARSYVLANLGKYKAQGYDVKASIYDQAYTGILKEHDNTNRAVLETQGIVMKHDNKVVSAFFHSSGGGKTEESQHVWSKKLSFLKSVADFDHSSPHLTWRKGYTRATLEKKFGPAIGPISAIFPIDRSPSNRVKTLLVVGERGCDLVKGNRVRSLLGLPGTNFNVTYENGSYVFAGQGFGHGLGLSQWGAKVLAKHGYNAAQILKYYYKDVTFSQIFEERAL